MKTINILFLSIINLLLFGFNNNDLKSVEHLQIDSVKIPDQNFEQILIDKKIDSDGKLNGFLSLKDAEKDTILVVDSNDKDSDDKKIKDLSGIEAFKNLKKLSCKNNLIKTLDISKNVNLRYLNCNQNKIETLDLKTNIVLKFFHCQNNNLQYLDISSNKELEIFNCSNNLLTNLI